MAACSAYICRASTNTEVPQQPRADAASWAQASRISTNLPTSYGTGFVKQWLSSGSGGHVCTVENAGWLNDPWHRAHHCILHCKQHRAWILYSKQDAARRRIIAGRGEACRVQQMWTSMRRQQLMHSRTACRMYSTSCAGAEVLSLWVTCQRLHKGETSGHLPQQCAQPQLRVFRQQHITHRTCYERSGPLLH